MYKKLDINKGDKYGRLIIIEEVEQRNKKRYLKCKCECGKVKNIQMWHLINGNTRSCGCFRKELVKKIHRKHGLSNSKIKGVYYGIIQRCNDTKFNAYKNYGGRGIKCEWENFEDFIKDMFSTYKEGLEIDRIDNDGNYCKSNCRWVTKSENNRNRRNNHVYKGKTLKEWSELQNIKYSTIQARLKYGWNYDKALGL